MSTQLGAPVTVLRAHEELFAYWAGLRQRGALPRRSDLDPGRMKRLLPTVSLTQVVREPLDYRLRLAGTGLYGVYGGEITGKRLMDVYAPDAAHYWRTELDKVVESRAPVVGCHSLAWRGSPHLSILWLRLPLAGDGDSVDMILGYDVVVGTASDLGRSGIRAA